MEARKGREQKSLKLTQDTMFDVMELDGCMLPVQAQHASGTRYTKAVSDLSAYQKKDIQAQILLVMRKAI